MKPEIYTGLEPGIKRSYKIYGEAAHSGTEYLVKYLVLEFFNEYNGPVKITKATPRHVAMYFVLQRCGLTTVAAGKLFDRDHSTVIFARESISGRIKVDKNFKKLINDIEEYLDEKQSDRSS